MLKERQNVRAMKINDSITQDSFKKESFEVKCKIFQSVSVKNIKCSGLNLLTKLLVKKSESIYK